MKHDTRITFVVFYGLTSKVEDDTGSVSKSYDRRKVKIFGVTTYIVCVTSWSL